MLRIVVFLSWLSDIVLVHSCNNPDNLLKTNWYKASLRYRFSHLFVSNWSLRSVRAAECACFMGTNVQQGFCMDSPNCHSKSEIKQFFSPQRSGNYALLDFYAKLAVTLSWLKCVRNPKKVVTLSRQISFFLSTEHCMEPIIC